MEPVKPGFKTTEFYVALAIIVLSALAAVFTNSELAKVGGMVAAALTSAGYGLARAHAKRRPNVDKSTSTTVTGSRATVNVPVPQDTVPMITDTEERGI